MDENILHIYITYLAFAYFKSCKNVRNFKKHINLDEIEPNGWSNAKVAAVPSSIPASAYTLDEMRSSLLCG
jgi:hypothetical protein